MVEISNIRNIRIYTVYTAYIYVDRNPMYGLGQPYAYMVHRRVLKYTHMHTHMYRCLVEAVEDIARALKLQKLMLCSTNDPIVKSTWHHLNFDFVSDEQMEAWDVPHADLVYLQNTTQVSNVSVACCIQQHSIQQHSIQ